MTKMTDQMHFDDLTKITCPPGMLDDDTLGRLRAHRGALQIWRSPGNWAETSMEPGDILPECQFTYRAEPAPLRPLVVPWSALADWVQWAAMDPNGGIWGHEFEPAIGDAQWLWGRGCVERLDPIVKIDRGTVDWQDSLIRRPAGDAPPPSK